MEALMNEEGDWIVDNEALKNMAVQYYKDLFTTGGEASGDFTLGCFPRMDAYEREALGKVVDIEETKLVL